MPPAHNSNTYLSGLISSGPLAGILNLFRNNRIPDLWLENGPSNWIPVHRFHGDKIRGNDGLGAAGRFEMVAKRTNAFRPLAADSLKGNHIKSRFPVLNPWLFT